MPLPTNEDYSSDAGQAHKHGRCICILPGIIKQMKATEDHSIREQLYHDILDIVPTDILQQINDEYGPF